MSVGPEAKGAQFSGSFFMIADCLGIVAATPLALVTASGPWCETLQPPLLSRQLQEAFTALQQVLIFFPEPHPAPAFIEVYVNPKLERYFEGRFGHSAKSGDPRTTTSRGTPCAIFRGHSEHCSAIFARL